MTGSWSVLNAAISEAQELIAAQAPDPETAAEGEAYITRIVTAALSSAVMGHHHMQAGLATALPVYGGPNPDYIMRHTVVSAQSHLKLTGRLNGSERVAVGLYTVGSSGAPQLVSQTSFDSADYGPDDEFDLTLAADATGPDSLQIPPNARILMVRILHRDTALPAQVAIEGSPPPRGPTLIGASNEAALGFVANGLRITVPEYLKWTVAARELPNQLGEAPPTLASTVQGDADTQYFLGGFDLQDGEWLEVTVPAGISGYWSLHAYNYWYEHLVTPGVHDRIAKHSADGSIRIAVGPITPPDSPNVIDTVGRRKGAFVCRIVGNGSDILTPRTRVCGGDKG